MQAQLAQNFAIAVKVVHHNYYYPLCKSSTIKLLPKTSGEIGDKFHTLLNHYYWMWLITNVGDNTCHKNIISHTPFAVVQIVDKVHVSYLLAL